ncbi:MAG TPA: carboxymuconolactone decarboxylase family protein [Verrucomicrobiales bacterium]|nr:carboxymuconolactone decarboxylase family protein [Verrucomicrobiales bacterium]
MNTATASPRIDYRKASTLALPAMLALQNAANKSGLEPALVELVKLRASQINGCAYCMDMHFRDARKAGEEERRLVTLSAWRELDYYTPREKTALLWTETLTRMADHHISDEVFHQVKEQFSETEMVNLTLVIVAINGWNRFAAGFAVPPGFV